MHFFFTDRCIVQCIQKWFLISFQIYFQHKTGITHKMKVKYLITLICHNNFIKTTEHFCENYVTWNLVTDINFILFILV